MNEYLIKKLEQEYKKLFPDGWNNFNDYTIKNYPIEIQIMNLKYEAYLKIIEIIKKLKNETSYEEAHKWIAQYIKYHLV